VAVTGDASAELYDEVPYPGHPFAQTHPDRLATLARLFGLAPAPPSRCRLLEIGCGDGGNLLPMASTLPGSQFVGIDISPRAIARARGRARAAGIENVTFEERSLAEWRAEAGSFDYVIAHGVYSWVPEAVCEALMALCGHAIAEHGVAYVSYNALPGGHLRDILRDLLLGHVDVGAPPDEQIAAAREMLDVLGSAWGYDPGLHTLVSLATTMRESSDALLFHDTLAPFNRRMAFGEFLAHAGRHGLQFLAEANYWEMQVGWLPPQLREGVLATDDRARREALLDELRMRTFRQTLLCRAHHELAAQPALDAVESMSVSAQAQAGARDENGRVTFTGANGANLTTDHVAVVRGLERVIAAWPAVLPVAELLSPDAGLEERLIVTEALLRCYSAALANLHAEPATFGTGAATHPRVTAMARLQAAEGPMVASLRHEPVTLDDPARLLVTLLDGTRDRAALLARLAESMEGTVAPPELAAWLERSLAELARSALLLA
jgi:SAM-dependent methyltransferase